MLALQDVHLEKALVYSWQSLGLQPTNPRFLDTLAEIYFRLGRLNEAVEANELARLGAGNDAELLESIQERAERISANALDDQKR